MRGVWWRGSWWGIPRHLLALTVAAAAAVGALAWTLRDGSAHAQGVGDLCILAAVLLAVAACARAGRRGGPAARAWIALTLATGLWAAGQLAWVGYGIARQHVYPFPSLADVGYLGYALPAALAILLFPRDTRRRLVGMRTALDGLVIASSVLFVSWSTVLGPLTEAGGGGLARVVGVAYPIVDLTLVSLVLVVGMRASAQARLPFMYLASGLVTLAVTDSLYVSRALAGLTGATGTVLTAGWVAAFLGVALAALAPVRETTAERRPHFNVVQEMLPYPPLLLAAATATVANLAHQPALRWIGIATLLLAVIQQVTIVVEKVALANRLEARVAARTAELDSERLVVEAVLENLDVGVIACGADGRLTRFNRAAREQSGPATMTRLGERITKTYYLMADGVTPLDVQEIPLYRALRGEYVRDAELVLLRDGAPPTSVISNSRPIRDRAGAIVGAVTARYDITERKQDAQLLREQRDQIRSVIETASDPYVGMSADGAVTDWNQQAETVFGWSRQEVVGRQLSELIVPERFRDAHRAGLARVRAGGEGRVLDKRIEISALHRDGHEFEVELAIWRVLTADGDMRFNAFIHDISERKRHEAALAEARDQALAGSQAKSQFMATMSHEIRTPMNGVIGLTSLLLDTPLDEVQTRYATGVRGAGEALLAIINDILDFSKLEAGKVEIEHLLFDPHQLVDEVGVLLAAAAAAKGLELVAYCDPDVPVGMMGDAGRIRQTLINLAGNAVKFTDHGEVVIRIRRQDAADGPAARLRFEVTDTGIGIAVADQQRLFEPFSQADASTTRRYGGTGLGLAICRRLVAAMHGRIGVDSEVGSGSTFFFELPLPVADIDPTAADVGEEDLLAGVRVLIVDDNETNRVILAAQLDAWRMLPDTAHEGGEGLQRMQEAAAAGHPYRIAVLDMCMPVMDGLELARAVKADPKLVETRLMILSSAMHTDSNQARSAGVSYSLAKPVRHSDLFNALIELSAEQPAAAETGPVAAEAEVLGPAHSGPESGRGRVLVVEDNELNQLVATGVLAKLGYRADMAGDGRQALRMLSETPYAGVLMDCHMPGMDGYEATVEIRRREGVSRRTPIIAMTAGATGEDRERCLAAGMDDFVSKPIDVALLDAVLTRWIDDREEDEDVPDSRIDAGSGPAVTTANGEPAIDQARLEMLRRLGPDDGWGMLPAVVSAFLQELPVRRDSLRSALEAGGGRPLEEAAHQLKGSAANIGASAVSELSGQIEALARTGGSAGTVPAAAGLLDRLELELERTGRALSSALPAPA